MVLVARSEEPGGFVTALFANRSSGSGKRPKPDGSRPEVARSPDGKAEQPLIAVHLEHGRVSIREIRRPRPPEGFALLRLHTAGICNTDLELQQGYYGFQGTPGHEFVATVQAVNGTEDERLLWTGRLVCGEINLACRRCDWCQRGLGRHCPSRTVLGILRHPGAFQEFFTLPLANLHVVPRAVAPEAAVFVEPLAAACEILDQVRLPKGARVAVLGDGKLGLLIVQVLAAHGAVVRLIGRHRDKLRIAEALGAETVLASRRSAALRDRFPFVVDATGSAEGLRQALAITEPRGTLILKSTVHGAVSLDTAPVIVQEISLVGSRCGRFEPALRLLRGGKVAVHPLIADEFALRDAPRAFARAAEPGVLKVLLRNSSTKD